MDFWFCFIFCLFFVVQRAEVTKVQDLNYLGSNVQENRECGKEVKKRPARMKWMEKKF